MRKPWWFPRSLWRKVYLAGYLDGYEDAVKEWRLHNGAR